MTTEKTDTELNDADIADAAPDAVETPEAIESETVSEPTAKRKYKQRAPKLKAETLDASESPTRKTRVKRATVENTARQLEGLHKMIAVLPNLGFMAIHPDEAKILAEAMLAVADEYDIQISGKAGATVQLVAAFGMVYVPRGLYYVQQKAAAKKPVTDGLMTTDSNSTSVINIKDGKKKSDTDLKTE
jgi:hypothetical protein